VALARRKEALSILAAALPWRLTTDVTSEAQLADFDKDLGQLDVLLINAGMFDPLTRIDDLTRSEWFSVHRARGGSTRDATTRHAATGLTKTQSLDGRALNAACGQRASAMRASHF